MVNNKIDRMRYQKNSLSFWLSLAGLAFNVAGFIVFYTDKMLRPDVISGIDIIVNIVIMLLVFMGSEKSKAYSLPWGKYLIIIGAIQFLRIFFVPLYYVSKRLYSTSGFVMNIIFLALSCVALIFAGIICHKRSKMLKDYIDAKEGDLLNKTLKETH